MAQYYQATLRLLFIVSKTNKNKAGWLFIK